MAEYSPREVTDSDLIVLSRDEAAPLLPKGDAQDGSRPDSPRLGSILPEWFARNFVRSSEELKHAEIPLLVRQNRSRNVPITSASAHRPLGEGFEIESLVFEQLSSVLNCPGKLVEQDKDVFKHNAMYIRFPEREREDDYGCVTFLQVVVEAFARDIGADFIYIDETIAVYLIEHLLAIEEPEKTYPDPDIVAKLYFQQINDRANQDSQKEKGRQSSSSEGQGSGAKLAETKNREISSDHQMPEDDTSEDVYPFPFAEIFRVPRSGTLKSHSNEDPLSHPLVIYYPAIDCAVSTCASDRTSTSVYFLKALKKAIEIESRSRKNILFIGSSHDTSPYRDDSILSETGSDPMDHAISVTPVSSLRQRKFITDSVHEQQLMRYALLEELKKRIRGKQSVDSRDSALEPNQFRVSYDSKGKTHLSFSGRFKYRHFEATLDNVVERLTSSRAYSENEMIHAINSEIEKLEMQGRLDDALSSWNKGSENDTEWFQYSKSVQDAVAKVQADEDTFRWEHHFLKCVVHADAAESRWQDIELEPDIQKSIVQVIQHAISNKRRNYGVLKKGRVGGAILYGLPGTGKTHLARVLACEIEAVLIAVSAADVESKWVGETEKTIKGLFALARMLKPSIIFLDEADSLLRKRQSDDRRWERDRVNQFLSEMDGLVKDENAPFVLLASNFPNQLDSAGLRRAPSRYYIRLPTAEARERILRIYLREEKIEDEATIHNIALRTTGYTGSDLYTLCVQAALACEAAQGNSQATSIRNISRSHFDVALSSVARTVSAQDLIHIHAFAKDYHPKGLTQVAADQRTLLVEVEDSGVPSYDSLASLQRLKPSETPISKTKKKWQYMPREESQLIGKVPDYNEP